MKYFVLLLTLLTEFNIYSQKTLEEHLKCLHTLNNKIELYGWEIDNHYDTFSEEMYYLYLQHNDTTYQLLFEHNKEMGRACKDQYRFFLLGKTYFDNDYKYTLQMDTDTLYFYKNPIGFEDEKIFIVGKYYYIFKEVTVNICQLRYLILNIDSLKKLKGNNLPKVPCIDTMPDQILRWEEFLKHER